jgi:hypothetical protein
VRPYLNKKGLEGSGGVAQVAELLPCKWGPKFKPQVPEKEYRVASSYIDLILYQE